MTATQALYKLGNKLYEHCYPLYAPAYSAWKAYSDRRERAFISHLFKPGMVVADIGANIGVYSRFFAGLVGLAGKVHAFEPEPGNFARLRAGAKSYSNIVLSQAVVGATSGMASLYISDSLNVDHRSFDSGEGRSRIDVPMVALDDYFVRGQSVDFIKIDVQGFELSVLKGASRTLADNPEITVLMEFWPYGLRQAMTEPGEVLALITALGLVPNPVPGATGPSLAALQSTNSGIDEYCNLILSRRKG